MIGEYYLINVGTVEEPYNIPAIEEVSIKEGTRQFKFEIPVPAGDGSLTVTVQRVNFKDGPHIIKIVQKKDIAKKEGK